MIGKYHTTITNNGLDDCLNKSALKFVVNGNLDSDKVPRKSTKDISDGYNINAQHSNNTSIDECIDFIDDAEKVVTEDFIEAAKSDNEENEDELYMQAFYDFGRLIHSIQDFYSHSNWINQTGPETKIWNESSDEANIKNPNKLKTTNYSQFSQFIDKINLFFKSYLRKDKNYEKIYNGTSDASHYTLNTDKPGTLADELYQEKTGESGFEQAEEDAQLHTKKKWKEINKELKESLTKDEYENLMNKISSFDSTQEDYNEMLTDYRKNFNADMKECD